MASKSLLLALGSANLAAAHFGLAYPEWRADTLSGTNQTGYSQWMYPCAGVPYGMGNTTDWPLDGGSLELDLHHDWTYIFVNLGLESGGNVTTHNITLTPQFLNSTGAGVLCIEKLALPAPATDGARASLQVVTVGESGAGLYNCANIRFASNATTLPSDRCRSSENVEVYAVKEQSANGTVEGGGGGGSGGNESSGEGGGNSTGEGGGGGSGASGRGSASLATVIGLGVAVVVFGSSL